MEAEINVYILIKDPFHAAFFKFLRVYQAKPFAALMAFALLFPFFFSRFAFSLFLCLWFIHTGYCPCWSRRVFLFLLISVSIFMSSELKNGKTINTHECNPMKKQINAMRTLNLKVAWNYKSKKKKNSFVQWSLTNTQKTPYNTFSRIIHMMPCVPTTMKDI